MPGRHEEKLLNLNQKIIVHNTREKHYEVRKFLTEEIAMRLLSGARSQPHRHIALSGFYGCCLRDYL
ncbi:MAG: hypothetical protein B6D34_05295 [Candidatus Brocadia sp. UTAMX1]|nr:MAG: hypothetical protein B6D34_05295 [Candidatus Brocadia sp. UTAMX1]